MSAVDALFVAASGPRVGMGHVVRTTAVAEAVLDLGGRVHVAVEDEASRAFLRERGLEAQLGLDRAPAARAAWLDGFRDWSETASALRGGGTRVVLVENRTPARELADFVVHPSLHHSPDDWERDHAERVRSGPAWIPLRSEVRDQPRARERTIDLLVTMGASDPRCSSEAVCRALDAIGFAGRVVVAVGPHMRDREPELRRVCGDRAEVRASDAELPRWMASSRFAVTALGTTLYELAHLGVRALVLANYAEDRAALEYYGEHGPHVPLGIVGEIEDLASRLRAGLDRAASMPEPSIEGLGGGAERIARRLLLNRDL